MKKNVFKKFMSVFLSVLMLMTCWVWVVPVMEASAASYTELTSLLSADELTAFRNYVGVAADAVLTVPTTSGKYFTDDSDTNLGTASSLYKNVIYSGTAKRWTGISSYTLQDNAIQNADILYPYTVLVYDEVTTPQFGITLRFDSHNSCQVFHWGTAISGQDLSFVNDNWYGGIDGTDNGKFLDVYASTNKKCGKTDANAATDINSYYAPDKDWWAYVSNLIKYTGNLGNIYSSATYSTTISPSFSSHFSQAANTGCNATGYKGDKTNIPLGTASNSIAVINVVPWKVAIQHAANTYINLVGNEYKYTAESVANFKTYAKALLEANPDRYFKDAKTDSAAATAVSNFADQNKTAVTNYYNYGQLVEAKYTVTWKNGDTTLDTDDNLSYGATVSYKGSTPTKAADATYHYTHSGWTPDVVNVTADATYIATFNSIAHTQVKKQENRVEATCGTAGSYTEITYCSVCDYEISRVNKTISATGAHTYDKPVVSDTYKNSDATCSEKATYFYSCSCGAKGTETFEYGDYAEHILTHTAGVAATCIKAGTVENWRCGSCGKRFSDATGTNIITSTTAPALGHSFGDIVPAKVATSCTESGNHAYKQCTRCSLYFAGDAATDAANGKKDASSFMIAATTHTWVDATCSDPKTCSACGATEGSALPHTLVDIPAKAPTCTETGLTAGKKCSVCNTVTVEQEVIPENGHDYDKNNDGKVDEIDAVLDPEPTCNDEGTLTYSCENCDASYTKAVSAKGHTKGAPVIENEIDNTCTTDGSYDTVVYCVDCVAQLSRETTTVPATGHADADKDHACDNGCNVYQGTHADADKNHTCDYGCADTIGTCEDANKDHFCDYGCTKEYGTCEDKNTDHKCDYGCGKSYGTCVDNDKDHDCDYGCNKEYGTHEDADKNHTCDYGCAVTIGTCEDTDKNHTCDYGCGQTYGTCEDTDKDHDCDYGCDTAYGTHEDTDKDHVCDYGCAEVIGTCEDENLDHVCDYGCNVKYGTCEDTDLDHTCDYGCDKIFGVCEDTDFDHDCDYGCDKVYGTCEDKNTDHKCDYGCTKEYGTCEDKNTDHKCDYGCGKSYGTCVDNDKDHDCDYGCNKVYGEHVDSDLDHACDYGCAESIGTCEDKNTDHKCDYGCDTVYGTCEDKDLDHDCDYGCTKVYGTCEDKDLDHDCDYGCDLYFGTHADADFDHACDYGCKEAIGTCTDTDLDHKCDYGCGKDYGTCEDKDLDHDCDYGCDAVYGTCEDKDLDHTCDYGCDKVYGEHADADKNHTCDYGCKEVMGTCEDKDNDHACDYGCDKVYGNHADENKDHVCDYGCAVKIGTCADANLDHACDYGCGKSYGEHADADLDHDCDYGCTVTIGTCEDKDLDHACDYGCDAYFGTHADADFDHDCDYGCTETIGTCEDADLDHACDYGCDAYFGEHADTDFDHACDYGCKEVIGTCEDKDLDHDCDYGCDKYFGEHKDSADDKDHYCDYGCGVVLEDCAPAEAVKENPVDPDCVNEGSYESVVYCSVCDKELSRKTITVSALGHTEADAVIENPVDPDCANDGSYDTVVYCSVCDEELSRKTTTVAALGHKAGEEVTENEVGLTCTTNGSYDTVVYCTVCGEELSRESFVTEAPGHTVVIDAAVAPTCTETGLTEGSHCSACGEVLVAQEEVAATVHAWPTEPTKIVSATCISSKTHIYECSNKGCSEIKTEIFGEPNPNYPHKAVVSKRVAPTCDKMGFEVYSCGLCGVQVQVVQIPATGHIDNDGDGICDAENCDATVKAPVEEDSDECGCVCHKENWLMRIIYKILKFFWKIFGIGKSCDCGAVHY